MLTVSSAIQTAIGAETNEFAWLVKLGEDLHYTNHEVDISYSGEVYQSTGDLLGLPAITRERRIKLQSVTIEFSNADGIMAFNLRHKFNDGTMAYEPYDRTGDTCEIFLALLDNSGALIAGEAISLYKGALDTWTERDSESSSTLSVKVTSPWSKPNLTAGRITSDHNQKDNYPGDRFFEFAHEEKNTIGWGAEA